MRKIIYHIKYLTKPRTLWVLIVTCILGNLQAQDPQFSQYYSTPLYTNPGLTGAQPNISFGVNYRKQSLNLPVPRETGQFSAIIPIYESGSESRHLGGVGGTVFQEKAGGDGLLTTTGLMASAAYNINLKFDGSEVVQVGIQGGWIQKSVDLSKLTFGSQYNRFLGFDPSISPNLTGIGEQTSYPVINAGVMYYFNPHRSYVLYTGSAFGGFSVSNINGPNDSFLDDPNIKSALPMLFRAHAGVEFYLSSKLRWSPQILALYQSTQLQFNAGTYFSYDVKNTAAFDGKYFEVILGLWYRWKDSGIISVGVNAPTYTIGFSYDLNVNDFNAIGSGTGGTFEISLSFKILKDDGIRNFSTPLI